MDQHDLAREASAARELLIAVRASGELEEADEQLALESETNIVEALSAAVNRLAEVEALQAALRAVMKDQAARLARFVAKEKSIKAHIKGAWEQAALPKTMILPSATVSMGEGRPKVITTSLLAIPKNFLRFPEPEVNKEAIQAEWREGREVTGVEKGNAEPVLRIRRD